MSRRSLNFDPRPRGHEEALSGDATEAWVRTGRAGRNLKRINVEVGKALHRRLRLRAAEEGRSMSDIVREALEGACPE